jgi:hypothetical protein
MDLDEFLDGGFAAAGKAGSGSGSDDFDAGSDEDLGSDEEGLDLGSDEDADVDMDGADGDDAAGQQLLQRCATTRGAPVCCVSAPGAQIWHPACMLRPRSRPHAAQRYMCRQCAQVPRSLSTLMQHAFTAPLQGPSPAAAAQAAASTD